jgi:thiaminase
MAEEMSKEEQIGFHKGSLSTLSKEREEFSKILNVVEQLMQMHIKALKELGVDLQKQAETPQQEGSDKPIDDLVQ